SVRAQLFLRALDRAVDALFAVLEALQCSARACATAQVRPMAVGRAGQAVCRSDDHQRERQHILVSFWQFRQAIHQGCPRVAGPRIS
ncbi:MAG: hypothetical protein ABIQ99_08815, partial [Thermoflexales bacterium]